MDEPGPSQTSSPDPQASLHAALMLLAQTATLIEQALASDSDSRADETPSPEERRIAEAIASIAAGQGVPDDPKVSARASTHRGMPIEIIDHRQDERRTSDDLFSQFEQIQECFTRRQWEVIPRYYRDGLTDAQIAVEIGKSEKAVYDRRQRALQKKKERERELREERFRLIRKYTNS